MQTMPTTDTFLPPIENPRGPIMKLVYAMTRRQFGKVLTPLKVHSVRLPAAFGMFYGKVSKLDEKLVRDIIRKIDLNEYKRKQAPPSLRVTTKAFGIGRRVPIAQRYVER